jgi:hypothetical protein
VNRHTSGSGPFGIRHEIDPEAVRPGRGFPIDPFRGSYPDGRNGPRILRKPGTGGPAWRESKCRNRARPARASMATGAIHHGRSRVEAANMVIRGRLRGLACRPGRRSPVSVSPKPERLQREPPMRAAQSGSGSTALARCARTPSTANRTRAAHTSEKPTRRSCSKGSPKTSTPIPSCRVGAMY